MNKNWLKYRLIFFAILIIGFFISRTVFPLFKTDNTPQITPINIGLNRNNEHLIFTKHAKCRMECRDITQEEVKEILHTGNINYTKSNASNKSGATYALEGYSIDKQHLRIIVAPEKENLVIVTCIDLDKEWQCDCN